MAEPVMTTVEHMDRTHALLPAGETILAARQTGLYQIDEAGAARNRFRDWLPGQNLPALALASDSRAGLLLAGIPGGVTRSHDGGSSWDAAPFRLPPPLVTCLAPVLDISSADCILAGTLQDGVFRSSDAGMTWRAASHGLFDHSVNCLALSPDFSEDGIVYAGTGSGIYRSDNGGKLWRDLPMPADNETVLSLALSANFADDGALYAGTEGHGLLRSNDGGNSWTRLLACQAEINAILLAASDSLIIQVDDRVLHSSDDGANWREILPGGVDCLTIGDHAQQLVVALADGGIRRVGL